MQNLGDVWFDCFLCSFSLEIKNGEVDVFGWISVFIFSENIFPNESKTGNNKILFSIFSIENAVAMNAILSKSKNIFPFENAFSMFLFIENKKQEVKPNMFLEF